MSGEEDKRTREQDRDGYRAAGVSPGIRRSLCPMRRGWRSVTSIRHRAQPNGGAGVGAASTRGSGADVHASEIAQWIGAMPSAGQS